MAPVSGTFTAVNQESAAIVADAVLVDLTFAGTATVAVQWRVDGTNWRTIESFTGSVQRVVESRGVPVKLVCTAYTNNVSYGLMGA